MPSRHTPAKLYFAYGVDMALQDMARHCPDSVYVGTARLAGYRFQINDAGVANVVPAAPADTLAYVCGLLYQVSAADEETLELRAGVRRGTSHRAALPVTVHEHRTRRGKSVHRMLEHYTAGRLASPRPAAPPYTCIAFFYTSTAHTADGGVRDDHVPRIRAAAACAAALGVPALYLETCVLPRLHGGPNVRPSASPDRVSSVSAVPPSVPAPVVPAESGRRRHTHRCCSPSPPRETTTLHCRHRHRHARSRPHSRSRSCSRSRSRVRVRPVEVPVAAGTANSAPPAGTSSAGAPVQASRPPDASDASDSPQPDRASSCRASSCRASSCGEPMCVHGTALCRLRAENRQRHASGAQFAPTIFLQLRGVAMRSLSSSSSSSSSSSVVYVVILEVPKVSPTTDLTPDAVAGHLRLAGSYTFAAGVPLGFPGYFPTAYGDQATPAQGQPLGGPPPDVIVVVLTSCKLYAFERALKAFRDALAAFDVPTPEHGLDATVPDDDDASGPGPVGAMDCEIADDHLMFSVRVPGGGRLRVSASGHELLKG